MRATCPALLILLDLITLTILGEEYRDEVHHYVIFSMIRLPFRSRYHPQHSVLKNPQSIFFPQSEGPNFAPIQHNWQNYVFLYILILIFFYETGGQMFLD
jgi:hypothetical protein